MSRTSNPSERGMPRRATAATSRTVLRETRPRVGTWYSAPSDVAPSRDGGARGREGMRESSGGGSTGLDGIRARDSEAGTSVTESTHGRFARRSRVAEPRPVVESVQGSIKGDHGVDLVGPSPCRAPRPPVRERRTPGSCGVGAYPRFSLTRSFSVSVFPARSVSFTESFAFAFSPRLIVLAIFFALAFFGFSLSVLFSPAAIRPPWFQLVGGVDADLAADLGGESLLGLDHDLDANPLTPLLLSPFGGRPGPNAGRAGVDEGIDREATRRLVPRAEEVLINAGAVEVGAADGAGADTPPGPMSTGPEWLQ